MAERRDSEGLTFAIVSHTLFHVDPQKRPGLVVLAGSIIACIPLKGMDIKPSPLLTATVYDSVRLAEMIVAAVEKESTVEPRL